ncbi:hypothetical protein AWB66_05872 [Caballeronia telluris]|uniref:Uncharacterized protein n=1 Tax=Caballeronia telluris TaxID=326475 RepID=A0A158KBP2_9BURK|nr:hypothetical protein AWB66_05872 [Caballeronia telluris]
MLRLPSAPSGIATSPSDNVLSLRSSITYRFLLDLCAPLLSSAITLLDAALCLHVKRATAAAQRFAGTVREPRDHREPVARPDGRAGYRTGLGAGCGADGAARGAAHLSRSEGARRCARRSVPRLCVHVARNPRIPPVSRAELHAKYQRIFGIINDDLSRRNASLALIASVLGDPVTIRGEPARPSRLLPMRVVAAPGNAPSTVTTRCVWIPARTIALRLPNTHATRASGNGRSRWVTNWPGFGPAFKFCLRNCMSS